MRVLQAFTNEALGHCLAPPSSASSWPRAKSIRARAVLTAIAIFLVFASVVVVLRVGAQDAVGTHERRSAVAVRASTPFAAAGLGQPEVGEVSRRPSGAAERLFEIPNVPPAITPARPVALPQPSRGETGLRRCPLLLSDAPASPCRTACPSPCGGREGGHRRTFGRRQEHDLSSDPRFYDPVSGALTFDGAPLVDVDPLALRRHIALAAGAVIFAALRPRQHPLRPAGRER